MDKEKKLRSLWGTTPILSILRTAKADTLLGIKSDTLVFSTYFTAEDFTYNFSRFYKNRLLRFIIRLLVFPWVLYKYDIFHFFCDRGILPTRNWNGINLLELVILKLFGKNIFVYTSGTDVRTRNITKDLGHYNCCMHCPRVGMACVCHLSKHMKNLRRIKKYATEFFSMGDMTEYTPGSSNELFFFPVDLNEIPYVGTKPDNRGTVHIVHAPNHRHYKGTDYLLQVVDKLQREGFKLELALVEKIPNREALRLYEQADIVADQFLIGGHGILAIEAMALGKPVICYIRKQKYLLQPDKCPIISANPDNLEEVVRYLLENPEKRCELGRLGRSYVEKYFSIEAFSQRLKKMYQRHRIL